MTTFCTPNEAMLGVTLAESLVAACVNGLRALGAYYRGCHRLTLVIP